MKVWNFTESAPEDIHVLANYRQNPPNVYGFGHLSYLQQVTDTIVHGKRALVDGLEGRKSLELIMAIYESVETGKEVALRFAPKKCRLGKK
jgi:predicted dehydrogenase